MVREIRCHNGVVRQTKLTGETDATVIPHHRVRSLAY